MGHILVTKKSAGNLLQGSESQKRLLEPARYLRGGGGGGMTASAVRESETIAMFSHYLAYMCGLSPSAGRLSDERNMCVKPNFDSLPQRVSRELGVSPPGDFAPLVTDALSQGALIAAGSWPGC
jgi:hypothetical protein